MSIGPKVINTALQKVLAFPGRSVIDNTTEAELGADGGQTSWYVNFVFKNLYSTGPNQNYDNIEMTFDSTTNYWTVPLNEPALQAILVDRSKWIASVKNDGVNNPVSPIMREFNLDEFVIDNDSLRDILKDLPFDYKIDTTPGSESAYMYWYRDDTVIGNPDYTRFRAEVYMGGSGNTLATSVELITHRGAIELFVAPPPPAP